MPYAVAAKVRGARNKPAAFAAHRSERGVLLFLHNLCAALAYAFQPSISHPDHPTRMQATALRFSSGYGIDALTFDHLDIPEPAPNEVLVNIRAVSLNYRDLMVVAGTYNPKLTMPATICSDAAGEVLAVGSSVTQWKPGDRVTAGFMPGWLDGPLTREGFSTALGSGIAAGVLTTARTFPEAALVRIPEAFTYAEAATLPCAGVTAWNALVCTGNIGPQDTVLLLGTGGVSILALQIAKLRGATTILTSSSDEKLDRARQLGADHTINYREQPNWDKAVRDLTNGNGATHVVEVGGAGTLPLSLASAAFNAQISVIGVLTTSPGPFDVRPILMRSLRVQGIYVGSVTMLRDLAQTFAHQAIHPVIDRLFPYAEAQDAMRYMQSGSHFGKVVIELPN